MHSISPPKHGGMFYSHVFISLPAITDPFFIKSEEERIDHEHELCPHRLLHCVWAGCEEMVMAKERRKHSEEHVVRTGVSLYTVPGKYTYKVRWGEAWAKSKLSGCR